MSKDEKKEALTLRESHRVEERSTSPRRSYPAGMLWVSRRRAGAAAVCAAPVRVWGPGPGTDLKKKRVRSKPKHPSLKEE